MIQVIASYRGDFSVGKIFCKGGGVFPTGEFTVGREAYRDELSKGNYI
jgi:hypothetical protein